ncbi:MAG: YqeG family HAD IIIA-type phosphatase [Clostridia bacterium]|nr:YqeG family HAD IIIA-type phosphatase [Clostridia bacterium]
MSLLPDKIFNTFEDLTVDFLKSEGIEALIVDVDNTLIPYEETDPRPAVLKWINELTEAGIALSFVTNNHKHRLQYFNRNLNFPAYHDSFKPFLYNMKKAMRAMGSTIENTANVGDQILTDIWAGKRLGVKTYLVPPIRDKRDPFTRFKRWLEKPILKKYYKREAEKQKEEQSRG